MPLDRLDDLRSLIMPFVEADPFAVSRPGNEYTVRSLYLDTADLESYQQKIAGLRKRKKVRIRGYNRITPDSHVFLEIKRKDGPDVTKQRSMVRYRDLSDLLVTSDAEKFVVEPSSCENPKQNAFQFLFYFNTRALSPVITVAYEREAYFSRIDLGVRITIDKNLRFDEEGSLASLARETPIRDALSRQFILEVKTDAGLPKWLQRTLLRLDAHRDALCKYVICLETQWGNANGRWLARLRPIRGRTLSTHT